MAWSEAAGVRRGEAQAPCHCFPYSRKALCVSPMQQDRGAAKQARPGDRALFLRGGSVIGLSRKSHLKTDAIGIEKFIQSSLRRHLRIGAETLDDFEGCGGVEIVNQSAEVVDLGRLGGRGVVEQDSGLASLEGWLRRIAISRRGISE